MTSNDWCQTLGISPPKLEVVAGHREANTFALLLVALLERGEPMTLAEVAARFEEADIAERSRALLSLRLRILRRMALSCSQGDACMSSRSGPGGVPARRRTR